MTFLEHLVTMTIVTIFLSFSQPVQHFDISGGEAYDVLAVTLASSWQQ